MTPTLTIMEMAVARAVTTMDVRESEATRLRPAIRPAAPANRFRVPRRDPDHARDEGGRDHGGGRDREQSGDVAEDRASVDGSELAEARPR